jgi:protein arginine kinase activator
MTCEECREREAVVHLTQIVNEQVNTIHLCAKCAAERGVESPALLTKTPLGTFLAAMGKPGGSETDTAVSGTCPACGFTLADFREAGRLGCSECYVAFGGQLRDLIRRLHGSTLHVGERYTGQGPASPKVHQPQRGPDDGTALRERLRQAVDDENFELAAELRDRLRTLE